MHSAYIYMYNTLYIIPLICWMTLVHIIRPFSGKKLSPYFVNDLWTYERTHFRQKNSLLFSMTLVYMIVPTSVKKLSLFTEWSSYQYDPLQSKISPYLMNDPRIYNRNLFKQKKNPIYWMTLVYIIRPTSNKKKTLIYGMTLVYIGPSLVKRFLWFIVWHLYCIRKKEYVLQEHVTKPVSHNYLYCFINIILDSC